jgi:acyl-CoA reductase-like NAD-dependent aldehyde dehydrogenase
MDGATGTAAAPPTHRNFVGGRWIEADEHFDDLNPYSGELVARVPAGTGADAAAAVAAAREAFATWSRTAPEARMRVFLRAADILEARRDDLLATLAAETGASAGFGGFQLKRAVSELRQAAGWVYQPKGELIPSDSEGATHMAVRRPLGVVAGFSPWNGALVLAWRTVVAPIAFGNTVVLKPSELAPLSAGLLVAEVMEEAGLPAGVLNVVAHAPGGAAEIADVFFAEDAVRCINFTGSSRTGRMLAERAGAHLKRIVLELGGYNPLIVLADVDLDYAVEATAFGAFFHQGEICMNARKAIVEQSIYDEFVPRLRERTERLAVGDPADPATVVGPLITAEALAAVRGRIAEALDLGATLLSGGEVEGPCLQPTILADVPPEAAIYREEAFGPVLVVEAAAGVDDAVRIANDHRYGLSAGVLTADSDLGLEVAGRLESGIVHVGDQTIHDEAQMPLGGVRDSGWGRAGPHSVEDFTHVQWVSVQEGRRSFPI